MHPYSKIDLHTIYMYVYTMYTRIVSIKKKKKYFQIVTSMSNMKYFCIEIIAHTLPCVDKTDVFICFHVFMKCQLNEL